VLLGKIILSPSLSKPVIIFTNSGIKTPSFVNENLRKTEEKHQSSNEVTFAKIE